MRSRMPVTLAAAVAAVLLAGCGSGGGGGDDGAKSPSPGAGSGGGSSSGCGDVVVTATTGGEVCLGVGSTLRLNLGQGSPSATEKGDALTEVSPGVYRGARAGSAELSGSRRACPSPKPGEMACHAIAGWKVTVDVR